MSTKSYHPDVFSVYTIDELNEWPRIEWIVENIIEPGSLVAIFGQSRTGKSYLALDLASKIAKGKDWFGYKVNKRKVIFLAAEGMRGLLSRVKAIEQTSTEEINNSNLMFIKASIDLAKPDDIQKIIETIYGKADVLIVDTFNAVTPGSDENSSKDMGKVLYGIRQIISECHCTVILVHHTGWDDKDRMRGHSSLSAATDTRIHVKQTGVRRQWAVTGQRDGDITSWKPFHLEPVRLEEDETISCIVVPIPDSSLDFSAGTKPIPAGENQKLILQCTKVLFSEKGSNQLTLNRISEEVSPKMHISTKHKSTRIKDGLNQLIKKRLITVDDQGFVIAVND